MFDELPQAISTTPALGPYPALIDCPHEGALHAQLKSGLVVGLAIVAALLMLFIVVPNKPLMAPLAILGLLLLGYAGFRIGTYKHLATVLDSAKGTPTVEAIRQAVTPRWFSAGNQSRSVIARLSQLGCRGVAVRVGKSKDLKAVRPIEESFEPIPLDETGTLFSQLEHDVTGNPADAPAATSPLMRNIRLGGGWLMVAPFSLLLLMGVIESIRSKRISPNLIQWSVITLIVLLGIGRGAWRSRLQWFLLPGGVAVRRAGRWKGNWQLELYKRTESVLLVQCNQGVIWTANVADRERHGSASMTHREAQMLLRAWLSPLPTPPLEQLSDLT